MTNDWQLTHTRIDDSVEKWDADKDEDRVDHLELIREDGEAPGVAVHPHGLDCPL